MAVVNLIGTSTAVHHRHAFSWIALCDIALSCIVFQTSTFPDGSRGAMTGSPRHLEMGLGFRVQDIVTPQLRKTVLLSPGVSEFRFSL